MSAQRLLASAAVLLSLGCSSGTEESDASAGRGSAGIAGAATPAGGQGGNAAGGHGDDAAIIPEDLNIVALPGGNGVLNLIALTLRRGPSGTEVYAALRNDGDTPACSAALSLELFDEGEQSLASGIGGLSTRHSYRLTDGSDQLAACVAPGDVTMAVITDWPSTLVIEDARHVLYWCNYFAIEVVPVSGLAITDVNSIPGSAGTAYTGKLFNGFDVSIRNPWVRIYPVNRVGRPLGSVTAGANVEIPPGGSWTFETGTVMVPAVDYAVYPAGELIF